MRALRLRCRLTYGGGGEGYLLQTGPWSASRMLARPYPTAPLPAVPCTGARASPAAYPPGPPPFNRLTSMVPPARPRGARPGPGNRPKRRPRGGSRSSRTRAWRRTFFMAAARRCHRTSVVPSPPPPGPAPAEALPDRRCPPCPACQPCCHAIAMPYMDSYCPRPRTSCSAAQPGQVG